MVVTVKDIQDRKFRKGSQKKIDLNDYSLTRMQEVHKELDREVKSLLRDKAKPRDVVTLETDRDKLLDVIRIMEMFYTAKAKANSTVATDQTKRAFEWLSRFGLLGLYKGWRSCQIELCKYDYSEAGDNQTCKEAEIQERSIPVKFVKEIVDILVPFKMDV